MTDDMRLPPLNPDELSDEQREVYDAIAGGPRANRTPVFRFVGEDGSLLGPFNAMLYAPSVGLALQELGTAVRFRTSITKREREIATLMVAARWRSDYEWCAHERVGRAAGLSDTELDALRTGADPVLADARERVVAEVTRSLLDEEDIGDALYTEAVATLGRGTLMELITLVGLYSTLALQMRVFRTPLPEGEPSPSWP